jgi:hypothetical protein
VGNDPLTFTDPSGFSWLSTFFHDIANFFRSIFANPIVRAIAQIAITAILSVTPLGPVLAAAAGAAIITGLSGGKLVDILKAAVIAGVTAFAFQAVGDWTNFHGVKLSDLNSAARIQDFVENISGHAAVGCLSAVASGGQCGPGAIAAAAGAAASPLVNQEFPNARTDLSQRLGGSALTGVVGGLAAIAGGGKFLNGAVTAAFGYLSNSAAGALRGWGIGSAAGAWAGGLLGLETGPADAAIVVGARWAGGSIGAMIGDWLTGPNVVMNSGEAPPDVKGLTDHGWERMQEDGISGTELNDRGGDWQKMPQEDGSTKWVGQSLTIVLNHDNWLVSIWRTGTMR